MLKLKRGEGSGHFMYSLIAASYITAQGKDFCSKACHYFKLELMGCLVGSRLYVAVKECNDFKDIKVTSDYFGVDEER